MSHGCYKKNPNSMRQKIEDLLLEHGPMTISDLLEELPDNTKGGVSKTICDLHAAALVYVKDWETTQPGQKKHPRPLWDHVKNSKRQPPLNKQRPLPVTNAARLKKRRLNRSAAPALTRFLFKLQKPSKPGTD